MPVSLKFLSLSLSLSISISLWFEEEEKAEESGGSFVKKKTNVLQFFGNLMH
jgi:hypothetical protein